MFSCKKIAKTITTIFLTVIICLMTACSHTTVQVQPEATSKNEAGKQAENPLYKADTSYLPGMCYIAFEGAKWNGVDYKKGLKVMHSMGVKSMRNWMHSEWLMKDPNTMNEENTQLMKEILTEAGKYGFQIIGMNHTWFSGTSDSLAVPQRNMKEGSYYVKFLLNYEQTWYNLVKSFPEIIYWEIGNEWNNDGFLHPLTWKTKGSTFTFSEKAAITCDMLYYASRGIHRANPQAITLIGGLCDTEGMSGGKIKNFYKKIYENILNGKWPSTDPDKYFQVAAWHPYQFGKGVDEKWVEDNLAIYSVIKENEKHDKKVFLTEFGWSDGGSVEIDEQQAKWLTDAYEKVKENMPFVESMHYFRLFNDSGDSAWGGPDMGTYGLMTEPGKGFSPKKKAEAYKAFGNGRGDLTEFMTKPFGQ